MRTYGRVRFTQQYREDGFIGVITGHHREDVNTIQEKVSTWVVEFPMYKFLEYLQKNHGSMVPFSQIPRQALCALLDERGVCTGVEYIDYTERDLT